MDFLSVLLKVVQLFLVIGVGFLAGKTGVLNPDGKKLLSNLVLSVTFPAYVLGSAMSNIDQSAGSIFTMLGLSVAHYALVLLFAAILPRLLRIPQKQVGTYCFMFCFANVGFVGFPVVEAVLGESAVFPATVFNLPFNLIVYTVGVYMLCSGSDFRVTPKLFLTPSVISCVIAMLISLLRIPFPATVIDTCKMLGAITTPAALLIIGSSLAQIPLGKLTGNPKILVMVVFRLVFMPLLVWAVLRPFVQDPNILGVMVLLSGMPVATNGTMLCLVYGGDEELMTQGTFLTTMLSLVTIPLMALLLQV